MDTTQLAAAIREAGCDAWVMFDFRHSNATAWKVLEVPSDAHCTRRWVVVVRADGVVRKLVHVMEQAPLEHVSAETILYGTREEWEAGLRAALTNCGTVAMEYSPMGELPAVSCVDAGTIELVRSLGCTVVSAADLAQRFTAVLTEWQIEENRRTAQALRRSVMEAFRVVTKAIQERGEISEYDVQQELLARLEHEQLRTDSPPIVAIGPNAASPHYAPTRNESSMIRSGMTVLIDAWARGMHPDSVYADITWVGYTGTTVPEDIAQRFDVLVRARNAAVDACRERFASGRQVRGYELDDACRHVVDAAGFGHWFIHRTGHNITTVVHGPGANLDNYETHDTRCILPGTSFSVEPGMYEPGVLGLRTELDVVVSASGEVMVPSEPIQSEIIPLLAPEWVAST